ncbi:hypothetical protein NPIL_200871 [Nephila pilipes]|uniref:Uncharacterized protein n=1 Tax=Nephila pilipes TaxID=299642 RepID=A0A8X6NG22_NEPPI|nr:hypothetical protein NPIL_200871 [Nephila pilipes]
MVVDYTKVQLVDMHLAEVCRVTGVCIPVDNAMYLNALFLVAAGEAQGTPRIFENFRVSMAKNMKFTSQLMDDILVPSLDI